MSRGFASNYRIVLVAVGVFGGLAAAAGRLVQLHVIDRERLVQRVEQSRRTIEPLYARRGDIFDARGHILATSRSLIEVWVDPQMVRPEEEAKWSEAARLLNLPVAEVVETFRTKTREVAAGDDAAEGEAAAKAPLTGPTRTVKIRWAKLSDDVEDDVYERIKALDIKGVGGTKTYRRSYPNGQLAAHVIGYVNREETPATGVEQFADFYLRGQDGWRESEKDGHRQEMAQFRNREVPPSHGYSVVLSIDSVIQHMVEEELVHIAKTFKPQKATIIVSEAHSGFVLAMANYPTFDLNTYNTLAKDQQHVLRNIAVADVLEPGSTFKIVAASGALNDGLVTPATRFDCSLESIFYGNKMRGLPKEDHAFDHPLSVTEIISHSSNKGAAQLAMRLGEERLYHYARAYGFAERTGFASIYPESPGRLAKPADWSGSDITRIPMGHTISATPLQIHYAMGVIANGGELLTPQIVREVTSSSGEIVYNFGRNVKHRVITAKTAETMAGMLQRVTLKGEGTAPEAAIPGYQVAGKTGTTQKLIPYVNSRGKTELAYSTRNHIGSFVGFFPASRPEVVISVIVDDGRGPNNTNGYGRVVAAPSFKRIGEQLIQYLDIKPVAEDFARPLLAQGGYRQ